MNRSRKIQNERERSAMDQVDDNGGDSDSDRDTSYININNNNYSSSSSSRYWTETNRSYYGGGGGGGSYYSWESGGNPYTNSNSRYLDNESAYANLSPNEYKGTVQ